MKLSAVIFDLNGTVLSDEDEYGYAFSKVLRSLGIKTDSDYPHISGIGVEENWVVFLRELNIKTDKSVEILASETQKEYLSLIQRVTLKKGFESFMKRLREDKIKTALATSNIWMVVDAVFERFDIEKYFDFVITAEEVLKNKPDPQIFELTAEKLGADPGECLVVEDSYAGIEAAHSAGMKAIGMARSKACGKKINNADKIVSNFHEITKEMIASV